jgi:hypothetical protein
MRDKPRRHPNRNEKQALRVAEIAAHMKTVGRKAQKGGGNDRHADKELDRKLRRMSPGELDRLMREDE